MVIQSSKSLQLQICFDIQLPPLKAKEKEQTKERGEVQKMKIVDNKQVPYSIK